MFDFFQNAVTEPEWNVSNSFDVGNNNFDTQMQNENNNSDADVTWNPSSAVDENDSVSSIQDDAGENSIAGEKYERSNFIQLLILVNYVQFYELSVFYDYANPNIYIFS